MNETPTPRFTTAPRLLAVLFIASLCGLPAKVAQASLLSGIGGAPSDPVFIGPATIDFTSGVPGSYSSLTFGNVKFVGVGDPFLIDAFYSTQYNTQGNSIKSSVIPNPPNVPNLRPSVYEFKFTIPVSAFAYNFGAADNTWRMDAYDSSNALIESHFITEYPNSSTNAGDYFGIVAPDIKRATITDLADNYANGDEVFIDDFTYSYEAVPEPATVTMGLTAALLGAAVAFRRRRAFRSL